jgi:hypothetical protein
MQSHMQDYGSQNQINELLKASRTFHRTSDGRDWESTTQVQREPEKFEHLIQWLKNDTGFRLQEFTLKQKFNKKIYYLTSISSHTLCAQTRTPTLRNKNTLCARTGNKTKIGSACLDQGIHKRNEKSNKTQGLAREWKITRKIWVGTLLWMKK